MKEKDLIYNKFKNAFTVTFQGQLLKNGHQLPIVLGWSGGADSTCLLYLLIKLFQEEGWPLSLIHAVYVDHGWRKESVEEMKKLREKSAFLGISFHGATIEQNNSSHGNLEEYAREERYRLLYEVCSSAGAHFLLIGHHKNDQVEGIIKRFFEGASLQALSGMENIRSLKDVRILRPLLDTSRDEIEKWLSERNISFFQDPTNFSEKFTRARLRNTIVPLLTRHFGKEIAEPVLKVAHQAEELKKFTIRMRNRLYCIQKWTNGFLLSVEESLSDGEKELAYDSFIIEETLHSLKHISSVLSKMSRLQIASIRESFINSVTRQEVMFQVGEGTVFVQYGLILVLSHFFQKRKETSISITESNLGKTYEWSHGVYIALNRTIIRTKNYPTWLDLFEEGRVEVQLPCYFDENAFILAPMTDKKKKKGSFEEVCPFSSLRRFLPAIWTHSQELIYSPLGKPKKMVDLEKEKNGISIAIWLLSYKSL